MKKELEVYRYYCISLVNRKTGESFYETAIMTRKKAFSFAEELADEYPSDFFDIIITPWNRSSKAYWIKEEIDEKDKFLIELDPDEKKVDYFTHSMI